MSGQPTESAASLKKSVLIALLLAASTLVLFSSAFRYDFVNYDDDLYVYENPAVLRGLGAGSLHYALTSGVAGTWAPITWLSYQLDTTLLGAHPSSYHITNVLLHAAAGVILFFALQLMLKSPWAATVIAGVFLLHPLRTESVAWIAERKDVLCALFWSLGLLAYWFYARKPNFARWSLVLLCLLGGVMSKMMMVTFPFVLLLLDVWPLKRLSNFRASRGRVLLLEKIPFFIVSILAVLVSSRALSSIGTLSPVHVNFFAKLLRVPVNYVFYIGKIFWPANLSVLYPNEKVAPAAAILCALLLLAITLAAIWQVRKQPWLLVGWLWFLGTLVPVVGFVTYSQFYVGDRYTYIPSIGLVLAVVMMVEHFTRRFEMARWIGGVTVLVVCALATRADLSRWQNSFALYDAALRVGPHHVTYNNRAMAFFKAGDTQRAMADFESAIALNPDFAEALSNRASLLIDSGNLQAAIEDATRAIRSNPKLPGAWNNRANAYSRLGELDQALEDYNQAIKLNPLKPSYYNNRAAAHLLLKQYQEAKLDLGKCSALGGQPHPGLVNDVDTALRESQSKR